MCIEKIFYLLKISDMFKTFVIPSVIEVNQLELN